MRYKCNLLIGPEEFFFFLKFRIYQVFEVRPMSKFKVRHVHVPRNLFLLLTMHAAVTLNVWDASLVCFHEIFASDVRLIPNV